METGWSGRDQELNAREEGRMNEEQKKKERKEERRKRRRVKWKKKKLGQGGDEEGGFESGRLFLYPTKPSLSSPTSDALL